MRAASQLEADFSASQNYCLSPTNLKTSSSVASGLSDTHELGQKRSEKVKVFIRLRPFLEEEYCQNKTCSIESFDSKNKTIQVKKDYERKTFSYDGIFEPKIQQNDIYSSIAQPVIQVTPFCLMQSVLDGYNGTILAYGQTGTGKTYSMIGGDDQSQKGIIPRSLQDIFNTAEQDPSHVYSIQMSCIQIYMEMLQDLINPENKTARIRESPENGVFVAGIEWVIIQNVSEALQLLEIAEKNRAVAFTALNACSSRSHVILMVQVQKRDKVLVKGSSKYNSLNNNSAVEYESISYATDQTNANGVSLVTSLLYLVDLAGSERVKKSKSTGDRLHEAKAINSSLSSLGKCIAALSDGKASFIPFRESKLTRLLQDSLGGNSKTSLIVTIGPSIKHLDETLSSLAFGQRAMRVQNKPIVNKQKDYYLLSTQLQQELDGKDDQIHQMEIQGQQMVKMIAELKSELNRAQLDKQELEGSSRHLKLGLYNGLDSQEAAEFLEKQKKIEVELIEKKYHEMLKKTEGEYKTFLEEVDRTLLEQEEEIDTLKVEIQKNKVTSDTQTKQIDNLSDLLKSKNEEFDSLELTYKTLESEKENNERNLIELRQRFKEIERAFSEREGVHQALQKEFETNKAAWLQERNSLKEQNNQLTETKNEIQFNLKNAEEYGAQSASRISELEVQLKEQQDDKAFMMQQLEVKIDQMIEHNKREINEYKSQIQDKTCLLNGLQSSYDELLNKFNALSEDLEEASEELQQKEDEHSRLSKQAELSIQSLESELTKQTLLLSERVNDFNDQSSKKDEYIQQILQDISRLQEQISDERLKSTTEIDIFKSLSEQQKAQCESQTHQIQKIQEIIDSKEFEIQALNKQVDELSTKIESEMEQNTQLSQNLSSLKTQFNENIEQNEEVKQSFESEILKLQAENKVVFNRLTNVLALEESQAKEIIRLSTQKQSVEQLVEQTLFEKASLQTEIFNLQSLVDSHQGQLVQSELTIQELSTEVARVLERMSQFEQLSIEQANSIGQLQSEKQRLREVISIKEKEVSTLEELLQKEVLTWEKSREHLKNSHELEMGRVQEVNAELSSVVESLQENVNSLIVQNQEQSAQIKHVQSQVTEQAVELENLQGINIRETNNFQQLVLKKAIADERILILEQSLASKQQLIESQAREILEQKQHVEYVLTAEIADKQAVINEYILRFQEQENLQKQLEAQIEQIIQEYALSSEELQRACTASVEDHCRSLEIAQLQKKQIEDSLNAEVNQKSQVIEEQSEQLSAFIIQKQFRRKQKKQAFLRFIKDLNEQKVATRIASEEAESLRGQCVELSEQLADSNQHGISQNDAIDHIASINSTFGEKMSEMEARISTLQAEKKAAQRYSAESAERILQLQIEIAEKEQDLARKSEELSEQGGQLKESLKQLADAKAKLKEYSTNIEELKQSLQTLEYEHAKEINQSKIKKIEMTFTKQALKKEIEALTQINSELVTRKSELEHDLIELKQNQEQMISCSNRKNKFLLLKRVLKWFISRHQECLKKNAGFLITLELRNQINSQRELSQSTELQSLNTQNFGLKTDKEIRTNDINHEFINLKEQFLLNSKVPILGDFTSDKLFLKLNQNQKEILNTRYQEDKENEDPCLNQLPLKPRLQETQLELKQSENGDL